MNADMNIINEFTVEAKDYLDRVEKNLLSLEKMDVLDNQELINDIFRYIHSIKGSSGFLNFEHITKLSHMMESLLQKIRTNDISPEKEHIDVLLTGIDALKTMLTDPLQPDIVNTDNICYHLSKLMEQKSSNDSQDQTNHQKNSEKNISDDNISIDTNQDPHEKNINIHKREAIKKFKTMGFHIDEDQLKQPEEMNFFILYYDLLVLEQERKITPTSIIHDLNSMGIILSGYVETDATDISSSFENQHLKLNVLYTTNLNSKQIPIALNVNSFTIINIVESESEKSKKLQLEKKTDEKSKKSNSDQDIRKKSAIKSSLKTETKKSQKNDKALQKYNDQKQNKQQSDLSNKKFMPSMIRINIEILDIIMNLAGELVLVRNQQLLQVDPNNPKQIDSTQRLDRVTTELQEAIMRTRMQPIGTLFDRLPRIVRDISQTLGKSIEISIQGNEVELDKTILESLTDPMTHIIRNACDHGIESPEERLAKGKSKTGSIKVNAYHEAGQISVIVEDDGKGIDPTIIKEKAISLGLHSEDKIDRMSDNDILSLIMTPGFSTSKSANEISGRGVGMDIVKKSVEELGGNIDLLSIPEEGTTIQMRMPLTLAIIPSLIVLSNNERFAIPEVNIEELVSLFDEEIYNLIECDGDQEIYRLRNNLLPLVRFSEVLKRKEKFTEEVRNEIASNYRLSAEVRAKKQKNIEEMEDILLFAVIKIGVHRFGLIIDEVLGTEEIVVNPLHSEIKYLRIYSGTTIMGDGSVALILDVNGICNHAGIHFTSETKQLKAKRTKKIESDKHRVMLFKSGPEEQFAVPLVLIRRVELIYSDRIQKIGTDEFISIDGVTTMVIRLENYLNISKFEMKKRMFLIIPKHSIRPIGILISKFIDTVNMPLEFSKTGVHNTALINDVITIFIDLFQLSDMIESKCSISDQKEIVLEEEKQYEILVAEDTPFFQRMIRSQLEANNYKVYLAKNGVEALSLLEKNHVDLIVSDIEMPEMDGNQLLQKVRSHQDYKDIPAIAMTSLDSEIDIKKGLDAGFNSYLRKINRVELIENVKKYLSK